MLTLLLSGRLKKSVSLAGPKVLVGTEEHQRRFGVGRLGGGHLPAWSKRQCTYVRRMVCGMDVSWLLEEGGVVVTPAMKAEVALQRGLLGRGGGAGPPAPPLPLPLTPTSKCQARHMFIDTRGLYDLMCDADMLGVLTKEGVTSLDKFRNGALPDPAEPGKDIEGPKVANRWDALLPDPRRQKLASLKHRFDQIVHTDGVALSVMFMRPKPADPPAELPRMGAVKPLAHLDAEWLGVIPGKTNMATVAHDERSADDSVDR
ncbi:hypothetical protein V8C86DRAFT_3099172 [Haematococcus lacustris]